MSGTLCVPDNSSTAAAHFVDRAGIAHALVPGHRDRLKPGWRRMLRDDPPPLSYAEQFAEMDGLTERLTLTDRVLSAMGGGFVGRDVLAVGCGDVTEPLFLSARGAPRVVGVDLSLSEDPHDAALTEMACAYLAAHGTGARSDVVQHRCEDIASTRLPDACFDLVCSWRTLEHLAQPAAAFAQMYRVLRSGGLAYHEYNPFFGLDGGHSLVTLDIPWGHVRFDRADLASYLTLHRPAERERALAYYDSRLNRMSLAGLTQIAHEAGFEVLALIPRTRTEDLMQVDAALITAAVRNYPDVTLNDLICRVVRVVLRRPANS